jgi:hypothetical protein
MRDWAAQSQGGPAARLEEWKAVVEELAGGITQHAHALHVAAVEQHAACPVLAERCSALAGVPPPPPLTEAGLWEVYDDVTQLLLERVHDHVWPLVVESCRCEDGKVRGTVALQCAILLTDVHAAPLSESSSHERNTDVHGQGGGGRRDAMNEM